MLLAHDFFCILRKTTRRGLMTDSETVHESKKRKIISKTKLNIEIFYITLIGNILYLLRSSLLSGIHCKYQKQ